MRRSEAGWGRGWDQALGGGSRVGQRGEEGWVGHEGAWPIKSAWNE